MKIILLGDQGQIGIELKKLLKKFFFKTVSFNKKKINLLKKKDKDILVKKIFQIKPDCIINASAFTNVNLCEEKKKETMQINYIAVKKICLAVKKLNCYFVHYSTDYVFDGKKKSYNEIDIPNPINYYGYSKLKADNFIIKNLKKFLILRVSWVYSCKKNNFIIKILRQLKLKNNNTIKVVNDEYGTPTSAKFIAKTTIKILNILKKRKLSGIYNISNRGIISRYHLAKFLFKNSKIKIPNTKKLISYRTPLKLKVKRPKYSNLKNNKVEKLLNTKFQHWSKDLKFFLNNLNYDKI